MKIDKSVDFPNTSEDAERDTALHSDILLNIRDLHVQFRLREGTVRALKGVTLLVKRGEVFGLVGESGCGKSVTAQAILRIIPKSGTIVRGQIQLNHFRYQRQGFVDIASLDIGGQMIREVRRKYVSIIFQEPMSALSPVHTIGNQIIESVQLSRTVTKGEAKDESILLLRRVGIPHPNRCLDSYSFELSGGMRQRAMIAMALVKKPILLIADEPTTAVDVTIQAQILELLRELQKEMGMAVLCITHNMGVVAALSQRVAVMYWGRIVEQGPVDKIFHNPKHPYTQGLIRSIPKISREIHEHLWSIKGMVPHPYEEIQGCHFSSRCQHFMSGICSREFPQEITVEPEHTVCCYLYGGKNQV